LPHLPRVQEENDPKAELATKSSPSQRNQPYIPLAPNITIIIFKSTFVSTLQLPFRIPVQLPQIPFAILPTIQLHLRHKPNSHNPTRYHLPSTAIANNISHNKLPNNSAKIKAQSTANPTTTPRVLATRHQLPNLQNNPYTHRRLQLGFPE
jgi:hypothetical protein